MIDVTEGEIHLFTYKEGMLSPMAHDLRLSVGRFRVRLDDAQFEATFVPESITVDGVMRGDRLHVDVLSDKDKAKIRTVMQAEVLRTSQYARVVFRGALEEKGVLMAAKGELELAGRKRPLEITVRRTAEGVKGEVELKPSTWGIRPYKALGGALKLQDRVVVRFALPAGP